jgi:hypothetical protein
MDAIIREPGFVAGYAMYFWLRFWLMPVPSAEIQWRLDLEFGAVLVFELVAKFYARHHERELNQWYRDEVLAKYARPIFRWFCLGGVVDGGFANRILFAAESMVTLHHSRVIGYGLHAWMYNGDISQSKVNFDWAFDVQLISICALMLSTENPNPPL